MTDAIELGAAGYRYLPSALGFASAGVSALQGHAIERAVFERPPDLGEGVSRVAAYLCGIARPAEALCGLELRMPAVLERPVFQELNTEYLGYLDQLGLLRDGAAPLTRTNVVPFGGSPSTRILAFSYTVPADLSRPTFVLSGVPELPETYTYPDDVVRRGDTGPEAMVDKARCIVDRLVAYTTALGATADAATAVHVYSQHRVLPKVQREVLAPAGLAPAGGVVWHDAAPPILELEMEIDVRSYIAEVRVAG